MNSRLKTVNLALFFTKGVSLRKWNEAGILKREIEPYNILAKYFRSIFLFTYGDKSDLIYQQYMEKNIHIINKRNRMNDYLYSLLLPIFNKKILRQCSLFKSNQMKGSWTAFLSSISRGKFILRTGYTWSFFLKRQMKNPLILSIIYLIEVILYNLSSITFLSSKQDKEYVRKRYHVKSKKLVVLPNCVNTNAFKPTHSYKIKDRVIFIGRLVNQKNLLNLVEALSDTDIGLDIIGDGPLKRKIQEKAESLNVSVKFLGIKKNHEIPIILNKYSVFILPSLFEGMPKALLEAMSCGLACIATNVEGSKEILIDKKNGLLANNCTTSELKKQILKLKDNAKLQEKLGKNARKYIIKNYSLVKIIEKELNIYSDLLVN